MGTEGFVSIRSNGLSFLMFLHRELRIKGLLLPKEREKNTKPTKAVKTFGPSVGAENAKQIGGIFPTMLLKCAAVLALRVLLHSVLCFVGASALANYGLPAKVPVSCVVIISFCLFVCTITELFFKDTSDL